MNTLRTFSIFEKKGFLFLKSFLFRVMTVVMIMVVVFIFFFILVKMTMAMTFFTAITMFIIAITFWDFYNFSKMGLICLELICMVLQNNFILLNSAPKGINDELSFLLVSKLLFLQLIFQIWFVLFRMTACILFYCSIASTHWFEVFNILINFMINEVLLLLKFQLRACMMFNCSYGIVSICHNFIF